MRQSLEYTGVAAVVTVWTTLLAASALTGFDLLGEEPLSYLGTESRSALLFTVGLAVPALLLTAFHHHLRGRFPVSPGFSLAMLAGLAGQMVAAFVPIGGNPTVHRVHTTSALVLGASLPLLMWRFAAAQPPGQWRRLTYALFWGEVAACLAGLYLSELSVAPLAEILPGAVFHAWVVTVTVAGHQVASEVPTSGWGALDPHLCANLVACPKSTTHSPAPPAERSTGRTAWRTGTCSPPLRPRSGTSVTSSTR
jgi:hypothetical protein